MLETVLLAASRAPTSFNFQPYAFVEIRDPQNRAELADIAGGQTYIHSAPVLLIICADLARVRRWCGFEPRTDPIMDPDLLIACVTDAALAGMCASLAAESLGLGTVMVGGIRNNPPRVAELLGLPQGVLPIFGICLGFPAERPRARPRLDSALCIHVDRYDAQLAMTAAEYETHWLRSPDGEAPSVSDVESWRDQLARGAKRANRLAPDLAKRHEQTADGSGHAVHVETMSLIGNLISTSLRGR